MTQNGQWNDDGNRGLARPRFEHDCDACTFLGQQGPEDVYYCDQGNALPTVIFRFGDDGPEYRSGWHLAHELRRDLRFRAQGLYDEFRAAR